MKIRNTMLIAISCLAAAAAFGQGKGIAGKWGTDAAIAHLANPTAAAAAAAGQSVMLDLKVDGGKVTGSISEFGNALCGKPDTILPIDSGMVDGKTVTFQTTRPACPAAAAGTSTGIGNGFVQGPPAGGGQRAGGGGGGGVVIWTGTLGDDDILTVNRAIQGGRGGGGRGGPGGAPPANNFVQGQGGGGGGRGGGGRGGGGALIMHRIP